MLAHHRTNPIEGAPDRSQDPSILKHRGLQGMTIHGRLVAIGLVAGMVAMEGVAQTPAAAPPPAPTAPTYTVPAGTKILLSLKNGINTKTAQQGDGVYLVSSFPGGGQFTGYGAGRGLRAGCRRPGTAAGPGQGPGATRSALYHYDFSQRPGGGSTRRPEQSCPARTVRK